MNIVIDCSLVQFPQRALTVEVKDRKLLEEQLEEAVSTAREWAAQEKSRGILVTRLGPGHFTVGLSDDVPFGVTVECRAW